MESPGELTCPGGGRKTQESFSSLTDSESLNVSSGLLFVCYDDDDGGGLRPGFTHLNWLIDLRCSLSCGRQTGCGGAGTQTHFLLLSFWTSD